MDVTPAAALTTHPGNGAKGRNKRFVRWGALFILGLCAATLVAAIVAICI